MASPFDLHVLGTPPAFILSQDQTLRKEFGLTYLGPKLRLPSYHSSIVKVPPQNVPYSSTIWSPCQIKNKTPTLSRRRVEILYSYPISMFEFLPPLFPCQIFSPNSERDHLLTTLILYHNKQTLSRATEIFKKRRPFNSPLHDPPKPS